MEQLKLLESFSYSINGYKIETLSIGSIVNNSFKYFDLIKKTKKFEIINNEPVLEKENEYEEENIVTSKKRRK